MPEGTIGPGTYGGGVTVHHFTINGALKIGAYCSFAADIEILLGGNHRYDWVTTNPFLKHDARYAHLPPSAAARGDINIGNDVWVGRGAMILSGVTIGNGAVIGARAVVARDVEPYAISGGNPAAYLPSFFDGADRGAAADRIVGPARSLYRPRRADAHSGQHRRVYRRGGFGENLEAELRPVAFERAVGAGHAGEGAFGDPAGA